jgi:hypothetical protein
MVQAQKNISFLREKNLPTEGSLLFGGSIESQRISKKFGNSSTQVAKPKQKIIKLLNLKI